MNSFLYGNKTASTAAVFCVSFDNDNDLTFLYSLSSCRILMSFTDKCASYTQRSIRPTMPGRRCRGGCGRCLQPLQRQLRQQRRRLAFVLIFFWLFIENAGSILEKWNLAGWNLAGTTKLSLSVFPFGAVPLPNPYFTLLAARKGSLPNSSKSCLPWGRTASALR